MTPIGGQCDARFAPVRDVFVDNFADGEIGAAVAVYLDGEPVVDLWGGWADEARTRPWQADTLVNAYSAGKPLVALAALQLVADGRLDLDAPVSRWWPALLAGQRGATVRQLLCHRAGVRSTNLHAGARDLARLYAAFAAGGALGFADPGRGLAFGYVMNAVVPRWQNTRHRALVDAVYRCLSSD